MILNQLIREAQGELRSDEMLRDSARLAARTSSCQHFSDDLWTSPSGLDFRRDPLAAEVLSNTLHEPELKHIGKARALFLREVGQPVNRTQPSAQVLSCRQRSASGPATFGEKESVFTISPENLLDGSTTKSTNLTTASRGKHGVG